MIYVTAIVLTLLSHDGFIYHHSQMDMLRFVFILLTIVTCGCATTRPSLSLTHDVNVPKVYRAGNFSEEHPGYWQGGSTIERYISAYERGWIGAVEQYAKDINFEDPSGGVGSGWVEEVDGYGAGFWDGRQRIERLIHLYGKQQVHDYLQQYKIFFGE